jgi:hypothetical protein
MSTTYKSTLGNWTLLIFSVCIALGVAEVFCRWALPRPGYMPLQVLQGSGYTAGLIQPNPTRLYQLAPNFTGVFLGNMRVETNDAGMRDKSLNRLEPSTFRILAVGDSFTFGTGIDALQTWPAQLEQILTERLPTERVAVVNAGVPGYGLAQIRDLVEELVPKLAPDFIVIGVYADGFNRLVDPYTSLSNFVVRKSRTRTLVPVEGGFIQLHGPMTSLDLWVKTHWFAGGYILDGTYELLRRAHYFLKTHGYLHSELGLAEGLEELARIGKYARERRIPLIALLIVDFDVGNRANVSEMMTNRLVERFCARERIVTFDPTPMLLVSREILRVSPEDYHWSAAADALVAKHLAPSVLSLIEAKR